MKLLVKLLALTLAVLMLASVMVACGDKKEEEKSGSKGDTATDPATEAATEAAEADILTGSWKQTDEINGDWVWTFDGAGKCHLKGITTGFDDDGTYILDEAASIVTVKINAWDDTKDYTYTLDGDKLDLESTYSSYHLIREGSTSDATQADNGGSDNGGSDNDTEQTWGEITVEVPASMNLQGGNGTYDPDDQKTVWLYSNDDPSNYITVTIVDSEDDALNNIETTKSVNESYQPANVTVEIEDTEWNGISYNAHDIPCYSVYATVGGKVFFVRSAGYESHNPEMLTVLGSLK